LSPDGTKIAIVGTPEITIHYPTDVWIIDRNTRIARKVTNSTVHLLITEDEKTSTDRSIHYRRTQWTPDGRMLLVFEETIDQTYSETGFVNAEYINNICTVDPETEAMIDFERLLPIQNLERLPEYSAKPDEFSIYNQYLAPDGKKTLIQIDHPDDFYSFILRNLE
jgi:hypothetical protein